MCVLLNDEELAVLEFIVENQPESEPKLLRADIVKTGRSNKLTEHECDELLGRLESCGAVVATNGFRVKRKLVIVKPKAVSLLRLAREGQGSGILDSQLDKAGIKPKNRGLAVILAIGIICLLVTGWLVSLLADAGAFWQWVTGKGDETAH